MCDIRPSGPMGGCTSQEHVLEDPYCERLSAVDHLAEIASAWGQPSGYTQFDTPTHQEYRASPRPGLAQSPLLWVTPKRKMARGQGFLALKYAEGAVPPEGFAVLCSLAAPVKHAGKDAAGHLFHEFALKQSGLLGTLLAALQLAEPLSSCIFRPFET